MSDFIQSYEDNLSILCESFVVFFYCASDDFSYRHITVRLPSIYPYKYHTLIHFLPSLVYLKVRGSVSHSTYFTFEACHPEGYRGTSRWRVASSSGFDPGTPYSGIFGSIEIRFNPIHCQVCQSKILTIARFYIFSTIGKIDMLA